jgi:2-dehydropantoate 2-reductase
MNELQHLKVCVFGAGAVGGYFGVRLAQNAAEVSVVARGATLEAIQNRGWILESEGNRFISKVKAVSNPAELGQQDLVIIAVKSHDLESIVDKVKPLLGPETLLIPALNGVPWWFSGDSGQPGGLGRIHCVDKTGLIESSIPPSSVIGTVVYPSLSSPEPGLTRHHSGTKIIFGEPGLAAGLPATSRLQSLVDLMRSSGLDAEASSDIRTEVWKKLMGNACFNPVSFLTSSATDLMIDDQRIYQLFKSMMSELLVVGNSLGLNPKISVEDRIALTRKLGHIKTSMLQDAERKRKVEIDAILGAACELGKKVNALTPTLDSVYSLARLKAITEGLLSN